MSRSGFIRIVWLLVASATGSVLAAPLSVDDYLDQVAHKNKAVQGLQLSSQGQASASRVSELTFSPQLFANAQYINDPRTSQVPAIEGNRKIHTTFEVGARGKTAFGLGYQLVIDVNRSQLLGIDPTLVTRPDLTTVYAIPEVQFALWQNWLGGMDRASRDSDQAKARASALGDDYHAKGVLVDARGRYWKLAVLREVLRVQREGIERANDMLRAAQRKLKRHLGEESDVLLAESAVKGKQLEFAGIEEDARAAARSFNTARGVDSDEVNEELPLPPVETLLAYQPPAPTEEREDVRAAEEGTLAATQGYEVARQKLLPELNLYGSIYAVGLNFSMPLEFGVTKEATRGFAEQKYAAQLQLEQKQFEAHSDYQDLVHKLALAKQRLQLALEFEKIQHDRFELIRQGLPTGMTVQAQVIQYQLDYFNAVLARVKAEGDILGVQTQLALFEDEG